MIRGGAPASRARAGLVVVHGRGAAASGMLDLADRLSLPDLAVIAPEAPGRSWWPMSFLAPTAELAPWLEAGLGILEEAFERLCAEGLPRDKIGLCGFSQGACLALEYAARQGAGLGPVFGFSGALVGTGDAPDGPRADLYGHSAKRFDYAPRLEGLTIDMSCHERDPHIPVARFRESAVLFHRLGAVVSQRVYPGNGHAIMNADIKALRTSLNAPNPRHEKAS